MSNAFTGEIRLAGFNFAPLGWALCNGALVPISQNETLYSLLGTTFGGDGVNTFGLPDLRGRAPLHAGNGSPGPGLSTYVQGEPTGVEQVQLSPSQLGSHNHTVAVATVEANLAVGSTTAILANENAAAGSQNVYAYAPASGSVAALNPATVSSNGSSLPHDNMQPYLAVTFIICLDGPYYPSH